ncbi:hypothetical protein ACFWFX_18675 [Streptomyces roseolus]|uniref:hypothetical protein n=1 Tax=Streptomyces roseolus TaxID=67358 RepID=UPI003665C96A
MNYPGIYVNPRDMRKLRTWLDWPSGSMAGEDLTVDAVEGGSALFKLHPTWMLERFRERRANRMRDEVLFRAYRALRDLGDDEGAAVLNELANKEWIS